MILTRNRNLRPTKKAVQAMHRRQYGSDSDIHRAPYMCWRAQWLRWAAQLRVRRGSRVLNPFIPV